MSILLDHIRKDAKKKGKSEKEWLEERVADIDECTLATHVGKFTHPDISKINFLVPSDVVGVDGYVTTRRSKRIIDLAPNSATYSGSSKLLYIVLENGKTVLENILDKEESVVRDINSVGVSFDDVLTKVQALKLRSETDNLDSTDKQIRQVYFPISTGDYHLLTVLPPSGQMFAIKQVLKEWEAIKKEATDNKADRYGETYRDLFDTTIVKFGGDNPQNISAVNSREYGEAYLLPAVPPPNLSERSDIQLLKGDFFKDVLPYYHEEESFEKLGKLVGTRYNNASIRRGITYHIEVIIDSLFTYVYAIRNEEGGWSDQEIYNKLPIHQKRWLDASHMDELTNEDIELLVDDIASWFKRRYQTMKLEGSDAWADVESNYIKKIARNIFR